MKDNFLYTGAVFYSMILSFVVGVYVKRIVLPEIVGAFAFVISIGMLLNILGSTLRNGVDRLVPKYLGIEKKEKADKIVSLSLSFLIVVLIVEGIFLSLIGLFFRQDFWQSWAFPTYSIFFITNGLIVFFHIYLRSISYIRESAHINFIKSTFFFLLWYTCVLFLKNVGYYVGYIVGGLLSFVASIYFTSKYIPWSKIKPILIFSRKVWIDPLAKEIWKTGFLLVFYAFLFQFVFTVDKWFIKFLEGNRMLAFYTFATGAVTIVVSLLSSFVSSFSPKIYFNCAAGKNQELLLNKLTFMIMLMAYLSAFIIFIGAPFFIELVLPNYMQSVSFIRILVLIILPFAQYNISYIVTVGKNRILPIIKGISIIVIISAVLNLLLYKQFGVEGIAWATVISIILAYLLVSIMISATYHLWYLTLLFLPVLILNFWLISYNMKLACLFLIVIIFICLYFVKFSDVCNES